MFAWKEHSLISTGFRWHPRPTCWKCVHHHPYPIFNTDISSLVHFESSVHWGAISRAVIKIVMVYLEALPWNGALEEEIKTINFKDFKKVKLHQVYAFSLKVVSAQNVFCPLRSFLTCTENFIEHKDCTNAKSLTLHIALQWSTKSL